MDDGSEIEAWGRFGIVHNPTWGILHARGTEVDIFDFDKRLSPEELNKIEQFLFAQVGKKYDYLGLFRFIPICRWILKKADNVNAWFCSELTSEACEQAGRKLLKKPPQETTPEDISTSLLLHYVETRVCGGSRLKLPIPLVRA